MIKPNIIVIYGATATGKSALAIDLAKKINGVIINADSSQIYLEVTILNNSPTIKQKQQVEHKLFNFTNVANNFSVGNWLHLTNLTIIECLKNNKIPIITGGTGLYINSLIYGLSNLPSNPHLKAEASNLYNNIGHEKFFNLVKTIDPIFTSKFNDKQRLQRAYEIYLITKQPISQLQQQNKPVVNNDFNFFNIWVLKNKPDLLNNIKERVVNMVNNGAIEEVKNLNNPLYYKKFLGAKELSCYINNQCSLKESINQTIIKTNQYAKRQNTWFKNKLISNLIVQDNNLNFNLIKKYFYN